MTDHKIKAFIIDDSALIRFALTQLLDQEADIAVIGSCAADDHLVETVAAGQPDILIFDIPLPREEGIRRLRSLHKLHLPSIVFTKSDTTISRDIIPLLEAGAVGFVIKPERDEELITVKQQLLHEIRLNVRHASGLILHPHLPILPKTVIAIGSSTGGPEALTKIFSQLPSDLNCGIILVQHMPADFTTRFAQTLSNLGGIPVKEAEEGDTIKEGVALLAPGDFHLTLREMVHGSHRTAQVHLDQDPPQWRLRPTVDKMMTSIAPLFRSRLIGVILSGMGEDGVVGMREIKHYGGRTLVQDRQTSIVYGMGQEVVKNNLADEVQPLGRIASRLVEMVRHD